MTTRWMSNGFQVRCSDGLTVSHPVLEHLPFQRSIEPWVRTFFPEARYAEVDAPRVCAAGLGLHEPGVLVLQAPKGTGKSKAIREAVRALHPRTSVVQVTFRRSLAWSSCTMLGADATLYSDVAESQICARQHPRMTVVVNSISRIRGAYDVVVVDEIVSVLDMLGGALMGPAARVTALGALARLVGAARTVVVADAMLDRSCVEFVVLCRRMADAEREMGTRGGPLPPPGLRVLDYVQRIHGDFAYVPYASLGTWERALDHAVTSGRRVVVPCMTKAQALRVAACFSKRCRVLAYTGDTDPALLHAHMSDIHTHWKQADLLVYSPVITAGCSFELPHFDDVFFYGHSGLGSVRSAVQMIARVRDLTSRTVHVFVARSDSFAPIDAPPCPPLPPTTRPTHQHLFMTLLALLEEHQRTEVACASRAFPYYFWSLVVHSGARIVFPAAAGPPLGDSPASSAAPAPTSFPAIHEHWCRHDWDAEPRRCEFEVAGAVAVSGSLLERVSQIHPDHLFDLGLVPSVRLQDPPKSARKVVPASVSSPELAPRARAWCLMMARKSAVACCPPASAAVGLLRGPHGGGAVLHPPLCAAIRTGPRLAEEETARLGAHLSRYMAPELTWMDVAQDAWALAGAEASVRRASGSEDPLLLGGAVEGMLLASRVADALGTLRPVRMDVGCAFGMPPPSTARFHPSAAAVDCVVTDPEGRLHLVQMRVEGCARLHAGADLAKLAVVARAEDADVASVGVLYLSHGEFVTVPLTAACAPALLSLARSATAYLRSWNAGEGLGFMHARDLHSPVLLGDASACVLCESPGAVRAAAMTFARVRKWVCWGALKWLGERGEDRALASRGWPCPALDLEDLVSGALGPAFVETFLDAAQASVMEPACSTAGRPSAATSPFEFLEEMYLGLARSAFLVFFWDGKPRGVSLAALPPFTVRSATQAVYTC